MAKLKVFLSNSFNPYLNLATEEWIFHKLDPSTQILFLWRNEDTVVIGRNQNPWSECNLAQMKEDKVHLARRTTGGGAVFHDLGNTNFTFLSPRENYRRENNIEIIFEALKDFGIQAEASGRNDLLVPFADGPRKFSGSAYREKKDRAFHHGTLLLHADLARLAKYLTPNPKKLQAKGKESVRARVANLSELNPQIKHEQICQSILDSFEKFYDLKADIEILDITSLKQIPELKQKFEDLSSFDWLYGQTMIFTQQMDTYIVLGLFEFQFKVQEAFITELQIFTDCLYTEFVDDLKKSLHGQAFTAQSFQMAFAPLKVKYAEIESGIKELENWLCHEVEM